MIKKCLTYLMFFCCTLLQAQKTNLLPDTLSFCSGDSAFVEIKTVLDNNTIITWYTPQGIITNTRKVNALKTGKYIVRVKSSDYVTPVSDSCYVKFSVKVKSFLADTFLCKGKSLVLDARQPDMKILWSTGETSQKITVVSAGRYWLKILNGTCNTIDTIRVKTMQGSGVQLNNEVTFCLNDENKIITVKVNPGTKLQWNTGATTNTIHPTKEGMYYLRSETRSCGQQLDSIRVKLKICECEMMIPNSFTPNEDNRNDYFFPVVQCDYSHFTINITDRWGNTVYSSNNINGKWDGRYKGNLCPEDIYVYRIESTEKASEKKQVRNGQLSLFR